MEYWFYKRHYFLCQAFAFVLLVVGCCFTSWAADTVFSIRATLMQSVTLRNVNGINFNNQGVSASARSVVIEPAAVGAAKFVSTGTPSENVTGSVTTSRATITCTQAASCGADTMAVDAFTLGGDMSSNGEAQFSDSGELNNLLIGATLHIEPSNRAGEYSGQATFRLVYR